MVISNHAAERCKQRLGLDLTGIHASGYVYLDKKVGKAKGGVRFYRGRIRGKPAMLVVKDNTLLTVMYPNAGLYGGKHPTNSRLRRKEYTR